MIDIFNFKRKSYLLDLTSGNVLVNLPLGTKAFKDVLNAYADQEEGLKMLTYVVNIAHYGSPANIIGLRGKERRRDVCSNLGLPDDYEETDKIKRAIKAYDKHYNKGIFGLFKELNNSFEMTRESIEIVNDSLKDLVQDVKSQQKLKTASPDVVLEKIKSINGAITQVRDLTTSLSNDVEQLKQIESLLLSEEAVNLEVYGGGYVPDSAKVDE